MAAAAAVAAVMTGARAVLVGEEYDANTKGNIAIGFLYTITDVASDHAAHFASSPASQDDPSTQSHIITTQSTKHHKESSLVAPKPLLKLLLVWFGGKICEFYPWRRFAKNIFP